MTVHETAPHYHDGYCVRDNLEMAKFVGQTEWHVAL